MMLSRAPILWAWLIALCWVGRTLPDASAAVISLSVSPAGRDDATGRQPIANGVDGPFATVTAAVREARRLRQARPADTVEIVVAAGRYELAEPLTLTPDDSGLTIRAAANGQPILCGGRRITGWHRDSTGPDLWTVDLPEVRGGTWYFQQLFVDGLRLQRARTPNAGFFNAAGRLGEDSPISLPFKAGDIQPQWAGQPDARVIMLMKWTDLHLPIAAVDPAKHVAMLTGPPPASWLDETDARYWIENVPDALDQPGEWYLDRRSGRLSLIAPPGVDPNDALVSAPRLQELVHIAGDPKGQAVAGLRLVGLTFAESDYEMSAEGLTSPQAAVPVRGAFRVTHATGGRVENCTFENIGGYAIDLGRGAQDWQIVGNTVRNIGGGGVRLGEPNDTQPTPRDACHSHRVTDNTLTALGRVFAPACGVIVFQSGQNRIAHNHISDLYYTGVSVGWTWGYRESPCRENIIEFNIIENVGQGRLSDMGGVYTLGPQPGTVVRNNLLRNVQSYRYGGWGLYTDEGSTGILIENNVATRCKVAGFHQHYGRDNVVRNNLLAWNGEHSVMRSREEPHRSFTFTRNVIVANSGTLLGSAWGGTPENFLCNHNVWFDTRSGSDVSQYRFAGGTWAQWQARGQGVASIIADPLLIDPEKPELGLKPESPAFALGYKQIDMSNVGPRPPEQREK